MPSIAPPLDRTRTEQADARRKRVLKLVGESSFWKYTGRVHAWLYRRTGGRIGSRIMISIFR